jgi:hypothetical protein
MALLMEHSNLRRYRTRLQATASAVEADVIRDPVIDHHIVNHHIVDIHIANHIHIHAIYRRVVAEVVMVPIAAVVSMADVPDVQPPESVMEAITPAIKSPVSRSP